jgi:hypothetical protein
MLFLTALLFVILSSGSLQCALNCYDQALEYSPVTVLAADCHPLVIEKLTQDSTCSFCHNGHSSSEVEREPALHAITGGQLLALFTSRCETPEYRSSEPVEQTFAVLSLNSQAGTGYLPLSQNLKQIRTTILLM